MAWLELGPYIVFLGGLLAIVGSLLSESERAHDQTSGRISRWRRNVRSPPSLPTRPNVVEQPRGKRRSGRAIGAFGGIIAIAGAFMSDSMTSLRDAENRELAEENRDLGKANRTLGEENRKLAEDNRQLTQDFSDNIRGADSFAFLHIQDLGTKNARAQIVHCGPNPARDTEMDIFRLSSFENQELSWNQRARLVKRPRLGDIYPDSRTALTDFDFPNWQTPSGHVETYRIVIRVESGSFEQILELHHDSTSWRQSYIVRHTRADGGFALKHWFVDSDLTGAVITQLKNIPEHFSVCKDVELGQKATN